MQPRQLDPLSGSRSTFVHVISLRVTLSDAAEMAENLA